MLKRSLISCSVINIVIEGAHFRSSCFVERRNRFLYAIQTDIYSISIEFIFMIL